MVDDTAFFQNEVESAGTHIHETTETLNQFVCKQILTAYLGYGAGSRLLS